VKRKIEAALNKIANTTDQSGNMKDLKKTIYETVSTLRNLFMRMNVELEEGKSEKGRLEKELKDTKIALDACRKAGHRHSEGAGDT